ncbi:MAG TPA: OmpA family protein [Sphingomonas sp.]|nr:OmpA family protein [Sphingomonas sp.]
MALLCLCLSAPAAAHVCTPGPFIIFFDADDARVDREGLAILDNVIPQAGNCGSDRALIAGYADTSENPRLARERIEVVRAYFLAHGFPRRNIIVRAYGIRHQRVATGRGVSERQNRRVEIVYGPVEPLPR